ncbi:MAG: PAS domain S-box protein [Candidatus Marinimicrobia bacterium]|nr:PAS domain S-box protein [Candidatus Neomarinimicrobiota bacterium]
MRIINRTKTDTAFTSRAELLGKFIELSSEAFFIFDSNLSSVEMNHAALELAGVSHKHSIGRNLVDLLPNAHQSERIEDFQKVIKTGEPLRYREYLITSESDHRLFEIAGFKIGKGLGVIAFEVSDSKLSLNPLTSLGQATDILQSLIKEPFVILDSGCRLMSANDAFYEHFQLKARDVQNLPIYNLGASQWNDSRLHELLDYQLPKTGRVDNYEFRGYFTSVGESIFSIDAQQFYHERESRAVTFLVFRNIGQITRHQDRMAELNEAFTRAPNPIILTDMKGVITKLNDVAVELYGWSRNEILNKSFKSIIPSRLRDQYDLMLQTVVAAEKVQDYETEHWSKKGEILPINLSMHLLKDSGQNNIGTIAYITHIASQSQAEKSLQRLRDMIGLSNDPVVMMDLNGFITEINSAAELTYGWTKNNIIGNSGTVLVSEEDQKKYLLSIADCIAGKMVRNVPVRRLAKRGAIHTAHISIHLITNVKDVPIGIAVVSKYQSDQEKASRSHELHLKNMLDMRDPVVVMDMAGEIVDLNNAAVELYGWKKTELVGKKATTIIPADNQKQAGQLVQNCKNDEPVKDVEIIHWSKAGKILPVQVTMFLVRDADEQAQNIVNICIPRAGEFSPGSSRGSLDTATLFRDYIDAVVVEDMSGRVVDLNEAAKTMLGWSKSEISGTPIKNIIPQDQQKQHEKIILLCQNNVPILRVESKRWSKKGQVFPVAVSLIMLKDSGGTPNAIANVIQDISELVKIREQKQNLERQVGYHN